MCYRSWMKATLTLALLSAWVSCSQPARDPAGDGQSADAATKAPASRSRTASAGRDDLPSISVVTSEEIDLVEAVLTHRAAYQRTLRQLRDYYGRSGHDIKQSWADFELGGLDRIKPYAYIEDGDIPSQRLGAVEPISEADALYDRGLDLMRRGGHGVPVARDADVLATAYRTFVELIIAYPSSDKIDDAAFQCAEILKDYFPEREAEAAAWYERTLEWNPHTTHPARFRAAVLYDYRLHDRDRALSLYREIVARNEDEAANIRYAEGRIAELSRSAESATADKSRTPLFGSP